MQARMLPATRRLVFFAVFVFFFVTVSTKNSSKSISFMVTAAAPVESTAPTRDETATAASQAEEIEDDSSKSCINEEGTCSSSLGNDSSGDEDTDTLDDEHPHLQTFREEHHLDDNDNADSFQIDPEASILTYLNPDILHNESFLEDMKERLRQGHLVVLHDAFQHDFATYVHEELDHPDRQWELMEGAFDDGFAFHHHNINEEMDGFTDKLWKVHSVFNHPDSKAWMTDMTGRDCSREDLIAASASNYHMGDHSLPHTDYDDDRTVAFVWHLSTPGWNPEWGGALFWCQAHHQQPFVHASFNTLHLFSVTPNSTHFVTTVSHEKEEGYQRLAFNGWYESSWEPESVDDLGDKGIMSWEQKRDLTAEQLKSLVMMEGVIDVEDEETRQRMDQLQDELGDLLATESETVLVKQ